jgi:cytochrome c oxidase subunit 3
VSTSAPLALPAAGRDRGSPARTLQLGVLVTAAAGSMGVVGLIAAYLVMRATTGTWPPRGVSFDNYTATMLAITMAMSSVTVEWTAYSIRRNLRAQALASLGLTLGLALAYLNGLWYLVDRFNFQPAQHPYATIAYVMGILSIVNALVGLGALLLTGFRLVGHQLSRANFDIVRATALYWHFVTLAWIAVYYVLYISK